MPVASSRFSVVVCAGASVGWGRKSQTEFERSGKFSGSTTTIWELLTDTDNFLPQQIRDEGLLFQEFSDGGVDLVTAEII
jgi:hypothetical protein